MIRRKQVHKKIFIEEAIKYIFGNIICPNILFVVEEIMWVQPLDSLEHIQTETLEISFFFVLGTSGLFAFPPYQFQILWPYFFTKKSCEFTTEKIPNEQMMDVIDRREAKLDFEIISKNPLRD